MITADLHIAQVKTQSNPQSAPIVFVVDDDISIRESLELLLRHEGFEVETFESAQDFLDRPRTSVPSCLILDISLPGLNGLDLQRRIAVERHEMPIIFITGHGSIPMSVQAMKAGAVEFLTKHPLNQVSPRAVQDQHVDRPDVEVRQRTKPTGPNRPNGSILSQQ
jgi:FixJ family two-component response regulator